MEREVDRLTKGFFCMNFSMKKIMWFLLGLIAPSLPGAAQTFGEITGIVTDPSGALISGARVAVKNKATGAARSAVSNEAGVYSFPSLPPGSYDLRVEKEGFRSSVRQGIELQVQQTARVDAALPIGQISEVVEVSATANLLNTENATVGTVIENKRIVELPLNGRNFLQLVALSPNTNYGFSGAGSASRQGGARTDQQISIAGQRVFFNRFTLDGMENTDVNFNTFVVLPSVDALQEFKVQSGIYPAEFGRSISQVNVSTKTGGNRFHGAAFEFLRNSALDAQTYAFTPLRPPKSPFRWNQYGFELDGPVVIPKLFHGRNRLFFMSNFEGFRERRQNQAIFNTPPAGLRTGNLSTVPNRIFDPATRTREGGQLTAQPFPNNTIPQSRIHPTSVKFFEFIPEPNVNPTALASNLVVLQNRPLDKDQFLQRVDFVESDNSNWFGRYAWTDEQQITPAIKLNGLKLATVAKQAMISNTRVLAATRVNEFRFGYNKFFNTIGPELAFTRNVLGELQIPNLPSPDPAAWAPPGAAIQGFASFGGGDGPWTNNNHVFQWVDNFSWTHGKHSLRVGAEIRRDRYNQLGNQFLMGLFNFDALATVNPASPGNTGFGFGDYLLGTIRQSQHGLVPAVAQFRATSQYYYVDDVWKIAPRVTLSFGLRYEYTPPWSDRTRTLMNLAVTDWARGEANVRDLSRHPVLIRAGKGDFFEGTVLRFNQGIEPIAVARDGRLGNRLVKEDKNDFAPRLGLAWSPTSRWTMRLGTGMFYSQDVGNLIFDMSRNIAGRRQDIVGVDTPDLSWSRLFLSPGGQVVVNRPTIFINSVDRRTPYAMQFMANVQRELSSNEVLEVGYLGSVSHRIQFLTFQNKAVPGGVNAGSVISRRPFTEFGNIHQASNDGNANYHSLSAKLQRRFKGGLTHLTSYTWSRAIDYLSGIRSDSNDGTFPQNNDCLSCERGLSTFHVSHRFVTSALYELPFGKGKPLLNMGGLANRIVGGWTVNSILTVQSGSPFTIRSGRDQANTSRDDDRPTSTGVNSAFSRGEQDPRRWFDTSQFVLPTFGTFGNVGRSTGNSGGMIGWDFSLLKNFPVNEQHRVQFRFEAFNMPNHPNWGFPNSTMSSASFGQVTSTRGSMRSLQFALKYLF